MLCARIDQAILELLVLEAVVVVTVLRGVDLHAGECVLHVLEKLSASLVGAVAAMFRVQSGKDVVQL